MARQYFVEKGEPQRRHIIARRQSYHGNTLGALASGGNEWRRAQFKPLLIETHHVDPCFAYRFQEAGERDEAYAQRLADQPEAKILVLGQDRSEERRVGTECGRTCRTRWSQEHYKKQQPKGHAIRQHNYQKKQP